MSVHPRAERDAQELLQRLGAYTVPVDPIAIASDLGIEVWTSDLEPDVAGVLVKEDNGEPEIYLNSRDHRHRQRFTAAHEVGHFVRRLADEPEVGEAWSFVDYRNDLSARGLDSGERYANGFAAALLMPAEEVRRLRKGGVQSISELARVFDVSPWAMENRLANLGLS